MLSDVFKDALLLHTGCDRTQSLSYQINKRLGMIKTNKRKVLSWFLCFQLDMTATCSDIDKSNDTERAIEQSKKKQPLILYFLWISAAVSNNINIK